MPFGTSLLSAMYCHVDEREHLLVVCKPTLLSTDSSFLRMTQVYCRVDERKHLLVVCKPLLFQMPYRTSQRTNVLQICDGRAFHHKCSFGEQLPLTTNVSAEHETPPIANVLLAVVFLSCRIVVSY